MGFDKFESWSGKDLAQFLIWDCIDSMNEMEFYETENILTATFFASFRKFEKHKNIFNFIDNVYNMFIFFIINIIINNKKIKKVLFVTCNKYSSIILTTKKNYNVEMVVEGKKDRLFAIKHFIKYDSYSDLNRLIYNYYIKKDAIYLRELLAKVEERIKETGTDYIVMMTDGSAIERAIVLVSKKLGITTLEIQHGVYQLFSPLGTGKVADYILVWGQYFKDLYVKQNFRKSENVHVLGYPRPVKKEKVIEKKNNPYIVYYLGQDFESYNKKFFNIKIETVKKINEICNRLGIKFVYRPHPGDNIELLKKNLANIQFTDIKEKLEESFKKADIFISFQSTALVEAAMREEISLQLMNYPLKSDNFEKLGVCNKTFKTIDELEDYLTGIISVSNPDKFRINFNNDYIETRYNPGGRFLEIIKEIEVIKKLKPYE